VSAGACCCCWLLLLLATLLAGPPFVAAVTDTSVLSVLLVVLPFAVTAGCSGCCCCTAALSAAVARCMRSPVDGERRFITGRFASAAMAYVAARFISSFTALKGKWLKVHWQMQLSRCFHLKAQVLAGHFNCMKAVTCTALRKKLLTRCTGTSSLRSACREESLKGAHAVHLGNVSTPHSYTGTRSQPQRRLY
jgi:hypothetical protein